MRTRDLIERLQELDPSGEMPCMIEGQDIGMSHIEDVSHADLFSKRLPSGIIYWYFAYDDTESPTKAIVIG